jgi:hypothetical protein
MRFTAEYDPVPSPFDRLRVRIFETPHAEFVEA